MAKQCTVNPVLKLAVVSGLFCLVRQVKDGAAGQAHREAAGPSDLDFSCKGSDLRQHLTMGAGRGLVLESLG